MTSFNWDSIEKKINHSAGFKSKMKKLGYTNFIFSFSGQSNKVGAATMQICANELKDVLMEHIKAVIPSINDGLITIDIVVTKQECSANLYFNESMLHRDSLEPTVYGGVDNIIKLFTFGYKLEPYQQVFGDWHGQFYASKLERLPDHFLKEAIDDFNSRIVASNNIACPMIVILSDAYK